ncbi:MAG: hypothetical protein MZV64_71240 [Ignavibacteriales bacterium]|nr:hypothetical protein [Ignavibacteriales bacterium]
MKSWKTSSICDLGRDMKGFLSGRSEAAMRSALFRGGGHPARNSLSPRRCREETPGQGPCRCLSQPSCGGPCGGTDRNFQE